MTAISPVRTDMPPDLLRIADLEHDSLVALLDLAEDMKADPHAWTGALAGQSLACFFEKPSTRTRVSFEAAAHRLGALPIMLRTDELQLGRGEPIEDTARVLASYCAAIVMRVFDQDTLQRVADAADVPVINALSDDHHPCQALADLLTLRERFGDLKGRKLAYVGDGNNVAHSLLEAAALMGMSISIACPLELRPAEHVVEWAESHGVRRGSVIEVVEDPIAVVTAADAVYTDVWVSMGDEQDAATRGEELAGYRVHAGLMERTNPDAVFMHCLPAHRGMEVTADVIDGPRSIVFAQAANRLPTEQAALLMLIASAGA